MIINTFALFEFDFPRLQIDNTFRNLFNFVKLYLLCFTTFSYSASRTSDIRSFSQPCFDIFSRWHWKTRRNKEQKFQTVLLVHNTVWALYLDSLNEQAFEQLHDLLHSCGNWVEMNILHDSKRLRIHQEL